MDFFRRKTVPEILAEIRSHLTVIEGYPERPPTLAIKQQLLLAAQGLAKRVRTLLKQVDRFNPKAVQAMQAPLMLIEAADADRYERVIPQAAAALAAFKDIEGAYDALRVEKAAAAARPKLVRGRMATYGRMMTAAEYKRLVAVKQLESVDPGQMIPAFQAPDNVVKRFFDLSRKALSNIYSLIGGTGNLDYVAFFRTDIVPQVIGSPRRWPEIVEVKFPHGTPVEIVQFRRV